MSLYVSFFLMLVNLEEYKSILLKGKRAQDGQFPWLIQFQTVIPCGGVLLSPDWVLTAAQCVQDKRNSIILFASGLNGSDSRQTVPVKATYIYPMYRAYSAYPDRDYNIALLKLTKPFDTCQEDIILPNILPVKYEDNYKLCLIFGWQSYISLSSKVLAKPIHYYEVILNSWKICTYMIKANANYTNIFCAMVEFVDEMKACAGNPGSPLVCKNENNETALIGIASWTNFSLDCGDLPTYLDLAAFRMWIDGIVFNRDKGELEYNNSCNNRGHISNISARNSLWNCSDLLQADSKTESKEMKLHNTSQGTKRNKETKPYGYREMSFADATTELINIYKYEEIGIFQNNSQTVKNLNKHGTVNESVLCNNQNLDKVSVKHDGGHIEIEDFDILLPFNFEDVNYQQIRLASFVAASVSESRNLPRVRASQNFADLRQGECCSDIGLRLSDGLPVTRVSTCTSKHCVLEAQALFGSYLEKGRRGYNHGSQCTRQHGQGRTEEADREHEVPSEYGTVAFVQEYCRDERVRGREREV